MTTERNNPNIPDVVQANAFQLVDDNGALRGLFTTDQSGQPYLGLYDQTDTPRLEARLLGAFGEPFLTLTDQNGSIRLMASLDSTGLPDLNMFDENYDLLISVSVHPDGRPSVFLRD